MTPLPPTPNPGTGLLANCVIWDGPDIPCLHLCRGDTITNVIYQLGLLLCQAAPGLVDVSLLDLACLLKPGQPRPAQLSDLLQLLVTKFCQLDQAQQQHASDPDGDPQTTDGRVRVPDELQSEDEDGELVVSLPVPEYLQKLAAYVVQILAAMRTELEQFTLLVKRVTDLESVLNRYNFPQTPLAFPQCDGLATAPQLSNPAQKMNQLPGWVLNPRTIADSLTNLWLTVCDQRGAQLAQVTTPQDPMRFSVSFEPGGTSSAVISIDAVSEVGTYQLDTSTPPSNVTNVSYSVGGLPVTLPVLLNLGNTLTITATTPATQVGTVVLLQQP